MNDDKARIEHMIEHVGRIQAMLHGISREEFLSSLSLIDGVSFNFAILGEAANKVSKELQEKCPEIPWRSIIGMRNVLIHDYSKSDPQYMWESVQKDLPLLLSHLQEILKRFFSIGA